MWLLDSKYCTHPEFTSNFVKQDGQDDQLIDIFLGDELMDIQCPPPPGKYSVFEIPILPHGLQSRKAELVACFQIVIIRVLTENFGAPLLSSFQNVPVFLGANIFINNE